jgi:hypothetical protein
VTQRFCQCGTTQAGINFAVSGAVTTSYCALGSPVPKGYTQIPATNGQPITTPSPKSTTTPTTLASTPPPPSKLSSTSSCNLAWCGARSATLHAVLEGQGSHHLTSTTQMKKMPHKRRGRRGSSKVFGDLDTKEYRLRQKQHQLKASFAIYIRLVRESLFKPLSILTRCALRTCCLFHFSQKFLCRIYINILYSASIREG